MTDDKPKAKKKKKKVTTGDLQTQLEMIQGRVREDLTSNQALVMVAVVAVTGLLSAASFYLGRRSR